MRIPWEHIQQIHLWLTAIAAVIWFFFRFGAVPIVVLANLDRFTSSEVESPWVFLVFGITVWVSWLYLEIPRLIKSLSRAMGLATSPV